MNIIKNITNINRTTYNNREIKYIVIHYVGAISTAKANSNYFKSTYRGASAHYFVDDNDIYQVVEEKDVAWHCGATYYKHLSCRNSNSIGIEMCCFNNNGKIDVSENVVTKTVELVKELMKKYNIPIQNILRHFDVTGKNCPAPLVNDNNRWIDFLNKLQAQVNSNFKAGDRVLVDIPIKIAYRGSNNPQDNSIVDSNGYQFWVSNTVIKDDNKVYGLGDICYAQGNGLYIVQIFDKQFWCREQYLSKNF